VKVALIFVIPSEATNLSFFSQVQIEERFVASLGMAKCEVFSQPAQWEQVQQAFGFR